MNGGTPMIRTKKVIKLFNFKTFYIILFLQYSELKVKLFSNISSIIEIIVYIIICIFNLN